MTDEVQASADGAVFTTRRERRIAQRIEEINARRAAARATRMRRFSRGVFSGAALTCAVAFAVGLSIPAAGISVTDPSVPADIQFTSSSLAAAKNGAQDLELTPTSEAPALNRAASFAGETYATSQRQAYMASGSVYNPGFVSATETVRWPFDGALRLSSGFGYSDPSYGGFHSGIDFLPGYGAPVAAIADGVVTWVGWDGSYGFAVRIQHNVDGVRTESIYGHMQDDSSDLYPGQTIKAGTIVGLTGDTGYSTGPHMHLGIAINGEVVDPFEWLTQHSSQQVTTSFEN